MNAVVDTLGWVLVHSLWQFALVALFAGCVLRLLQRSTAEARYGVLVAALALVVAFPIATYWLAPESLTSDGSTASSSRLDVGSLSATGDDDQIGRLNHSGDMDDESESASAGRAVLSSLDTEAGVNSGRRSLGSDGSGGTRVVVDRQRVVGGWSSAVLAKLHPWIDWIVASWGLGVVVCSLRPVLGLRMLWQLKRVGLSPVSESVMAATQRVARHLEVGRVVVVWQSALAQVPVVVGYFRPMILLPASLLTTLSIEQLEAILAHELAHVRRHDFLANLIQTIVETLFFFHPAVWWLSSRMRIEREHCCDDLVVRVFENRVEYGRALIAVEELRGQSALLALGVADGSLLARVRRIVGTTGSKVSSHSASDRLSITFGGFASLLLVVAISLSTFIAPRADSLDLPVPELAAADGVALEQPLAADRDALPPGLLRGIGEARSKVAGSGSRQSTRQIGEAGNGHVEPPHELLFTTDGELVSAGIDGAHVWNVKTAEHRLDISHGGPTTIRGLTISPDNQLIVTSGFDDTLGVWNKKTGKRIHTLKGHGKVGGFRSVRFAAGGSVIVSWGDDAHLRCWDAQEGTLIAEQDLRLPGYAEQGSLGAMSAGMPGTLSHDAKSLFVRFQDDLIEFDTGSGEILRRVPAVIDLSPVVLAGNGKWIVGVRSERDQKRDITGTAIVLIDRVTLKEVRAWKAIEQNSRTVDNEQAARVFVGESAGEIAFSTDSRQLAWSQSGTHNQIVVADVVSGRITHRIKTSDLSHSVVFSHNGKQLASGNRDSRILLWDLENPALFASKVQNALRVDVPNGIRLELVGISSVHPEQGGADQRLWWGKDGGVLGTTDELFHAGERLTGTSEFAVGREVVVRLTQLTDTPFVKAMSQRAALIVTEVDGVLSGPAVIGEETQPPKVFQMATAGLRAASAPIDLRLHTQFVPGKEAKTSRIRFGFNHDQTMKTFDITGKLDHETSVAKYPEIWRQFEFLRMENSPAGVIVWTKATRHLNDLGQTSVLLMMVDGRVLSAQVPRQSEDKSEHGILFPKSKLQDVEGVTLSVRPVTHWVTFAGLPLAAGQTTPASVSVVAVEHSSQKESTAPKIQSAIDKAIEFLKAQQRSDGTWQDRSAPKDGLTALAVVALLQSGVPMSEPAVKKGLEYLRSIEPEGTYFTSLQTIALCWGDAKSDAERIRRNVYWLEKAQSSIGGWRYGMPPENLRDATDSDGSNTRFAVWALHEAARSGFDVQPGTWKRIRDYWTKSQTNDGGFGYTPGTPATPTMTLAGVGCLAMARKHLNSVDEWTHQDPLVQRAVAWLERTDGNENRPRFLPSGKAAWFCYHAQALERFGNVGEVAEIGNRNWRTEIASLFLDSAGADGSWNGKAETPIIATSFVLMTLTGKPEQKLNAKVPERLKPAFDLPDRVNVMSAGFDRDGSNIVSVSTEHHVMLRTWSVREKTLINEAKLATERHGNFFVNSLLTLSADRSKVVGIVDGRVGIWETKTGKQLHSLTPPGTNGGSLDGLASTPDLSLVASGYSQSGFGRGEATVVVWNVDTGEVIQTVQHQDAIQIHTVALSPDGKRLASGSQSGDTCVWDVSTGKLLWKLSNPLHGRRHPDQEVSDEGAKQVLCLAFTPDGKQLAIGDMLSVRLVETNSGRELHRLDAPYRFGRSGLVFSHDGLILARVGTDKTVPIWSVDKGTLLAELPTESHSGAFSPDGCWFAVGFTDSKRGVAVWKLREERAEAAQAQRAVVEQPTQRFTEKQGRGEKVQSPAAVTVLIDQRAAKPNLKPLPEQLQKHVGDGVLAVRDQQEEVVAMYLSRTTTDEMLAELATLPKLRELNIEATQGLTAAGLAHIGRLSQLKRVSFYNVNEQDGHFGDVLIRNVSHLKSLRELSIAECGTTDSGCRQLASMTDLESLSLSNEGLLTDAALDSISLLTQLKSLSLNSTIATTRLGRMQFSQAGIRRLGELTNLESLHLIGHPVTADVLASPNLREISLGHSAVDDVVATRLARLTQLRQLNLIRCRITNDGLIPIARLKQLQHLDLESEEVTDRGIAAFESHPTLSYLNLRLAKLSDAGVKSVSTIPKLSHLSLWGSSQLAGNPNPNLSADGLLPLVQLPQLRVMSLTNWTTGRSWLRLQQFKSLDQLSFLMCDIQEEEVRLLDEALPDTQVIHATGGGGFLSEKALAKQQRLLERALKRQQNHDE